MEDLSGFCCLNSQCADCGRRGGKNLTVTARHGKDKQFRLLRCRTCKARFSERKGTPLFGARLPEEKIVSILAHVGEGCGVRKTHRLTGVSIGTVLRYGRRAGKHARALHDQLVAFSPDDPRGAVR